jgi:hypothetical protein
VVAPADHLEARGEQVPEAFQVFLVAGFGAQRKRARGGVHGPLAPVQGDGPVCFRPLGVPDLRGLAAVGVAAGPVQPACAHLAGVLAQLSEVPAGAAGLDGGL